MKKHWVLVPAVLLVVALLSVHDVWGGCYECPLDTGCNSTQCPGGVFDTKPTCGTYVSFLYNHYVCINGTSKNTCTYIDPLYSCAKKYECVQVQRSDGKWVCNTTTNHDSNITVQSTDCH